MRTIRRIGLTVLGIFALTFTSVPALALSEHAAGRAEAATSTTTSETETETDNNSTTGTTTSGLSADHRAAAQTKLADAKLKSCQNRQKAINHIMARIAERGQRQVNLFSTIATRTETFYTNKGKTLSNYDALVADVNAKKDAAQTTVDTLKSSSVSFKCDGTDPHGAAQSFKANLKAEISALKAYRTSVKNLIVGVKSVQGTSTSTTNDTNSNPDTTGGSQ